MTIVLLHNNFGTKLHLTITPNLTPTRLLTRTFWPNLNSDSLIEKRISSNKSREVLCRCVI